MSPAPPHTDDAPAPLFEKRINQVPVDGRKIAMSAKPSPS